MEAQVAQLTAEQFDVLMASLDSVQSAVKLYGEVNSVCTVVSVFFLAFEIVAFAFWFTIFRE